MVVQDRIPSSVESSPHEAPQGGGFEKVVPADLGSARNAEVLKGLVESVRGGGGGASEGRQGLDLLVVNMPVHLRVCFSCLRNLLSSSLWSELFRGYFAAFWALKGMSVRLSSEMSLRGPAFS